MTEAKKPTLVIPAEPKKPEFKPDHPSRSCATCDHGFFPSADNTTGNCRVDPPKSTTFLLPPPVHGQPPRPDSVSSWPIVYKHQFCGSQYRRKPELMQ